MTQGRDGFSLAHRAALMAGSVKRALATVLTVAVIASLAVVVTTATGYAKGKKVGTTRTRGLTDKLVVSNGGATLDGTIATFKVKSFRSQRPIAVINGSASYYLAGIAVNPNSVAPGTGPSVIDAIYAASDLSFLSKPTKKLPDAVYGWAPGASGASSPIVSMFSLPPICLAKNSAGDCVFLYPGNPMSKPEGIAFIPSTADPETGESEEGAETGEPGAAADFYVTQLMGGVVDPKTGLPAAGDTGSVLEYLPNAGSGSALGALLSTHPIGEIEDTVACTSDEHATFLLGPVGVALDASNNIWVVNSGAGTGASYVTEYAAGSSTPVSCVDPIITIGKGILEEGAFDAISPIDGTVWVSDLTQNAIFEFDPGDGDVLTTIAGKRTQLLGPMGVAMNSLGDLYVANNERSQILEFEDPALGGLLNVRPNVTLLGGRSELSQPVGVALSTGVPPLKPVVR